MSKLEVASSFVQTGIERLSLLGTHAKALMDGYLSEFIDEAAFTEQALRKLINAQILWRPDEQSGLKLTKVVCDLIAQMLADEKRRTVNADVAEDLEHILALVESYKEAYYRGDYLLADDHLLHLTQVVDGIHSNFSSAIDSLWKRINTDFAFVSSLTEKIRENQRAQKQVTRLLDGFALIDFDRLIENAGLNGALRKLLVSQFQAHMSTHYSSLREVQQRLLELIARFRKQQERSWLVQQMSDFLRTHPKFTPENYALRAAIPDLINQASPLLAKVNLALDRTQDLPLLAELVQEQPARQRLDTAIDVNLDSVIVWFEDEQIQARQQQLKLDVENFYIEVLDTRRKLSAVEHLVQSQLNWDSEMWLFQVIGYYDALPDLEQKKFKLIRDESYASYWNEVLWIKDVEVVLV
ncbi:hypothetical protein VQ643_07930 [Pseudomonas sp. F1_0610]|uniref:hypothetical protein n=1 Tax=Pseudomonas sp. F1_0610 TaxID=3114284 RepID=UPI0039C01C99